MIALLDLEPVTFVTLEVYPFLGESVARFKAKCMPTFAQYIIDVRYDGKDVKITFPGFPGSQVTPKCRLVMGLFNKRSNFKKILFKAFSFMHHKSNLRRIYFDVDDITLVATKNSNPEELVREYFRKEDYIVYENDTEKEIVERDEEILDFYSVVYNLFLAKTDNSDLERKKEKIYFLSSKAEESYLQRESAIYDDRFMRFLKTYQLDPDAPYESRQRLALLKEWLNV